jgi:hypothetical protein
MGVMLREAWGIHIRVDVGPALLRVPGNASVCNLPRVGLPSNANVALFVFLRGHGCRRGPRHRIRRYKTSGDGGGNEF